MGPNQREIKRRLRVLKHSEKIGNVHMTCRYFGLARSTFYRWKTDYDKHGEAGLVRKSATSINHPRKTPAEIVEKIVHLRHQYTAIDDATRARALKIYPRRNQANACDFVDCLIEKFPFRIHTIRTDRGHEFQAKFHWHVEDKGIRHVCIKPRSPQLNGKVERSHRSDQEEFYQLLNCVDDTDLNKKLAEWENFYNFYRPHGAFAGKTPYEILRERLQ